MSRGRERTGSVNEVQLQEAVKYWLTEGAKGVRDCLSNHMSKFSFGKRERLARRLQFGKVMDQGQKRKIENFCTLFFLPNDLNKKRLGIIASKKIGNAVVRNLVKRKIREVFRHIKDRIEPTICLLYTSDAADE